MNFNDTTLILKLLAGEKLEVIYLKVYNLKKCVLPVDNEALLFSIHNSY
jgi:hypothetical protein